MKKTTKKKSTKPSPKKSKAKPTKKVKKTSKPITEAAEYAEVAADRKAAEKSKAKPEETMDRTALKVIASQLKEMGSDIKVFKSDTDEALQKKVNEHLQNMPKAGILKKLESIVPEKLVTVLKRDCIGIFIDLQDVSCTKCRDSGQCASEFLKNLKGGFGDLAKALPTTKVVEKPVEKVKLKAVSRYEEDRLVFVRDVPNPNPVGDAYHDMLQAVLDEQPDTLSELRAIVERDFDIDSDSDFMKLVTNMRDSMEGVIKLDVDLSEKNKAELRKAGVEI